MILDNLLELCCADDSNIPRNPEYYNALKEVQEHVDDLQLALNKEQFEKVTDLLQAIALKDAISLEDEFKFGLCIGVTLMLEIQEYAHRILLAKEHK